MKNTLSKIQARKELNFCFRNSLTYNEAISKFFQSVICPWLEINDAYLPTKPMDYRHLNEDGSNRIIPKTNLIDEALLHFNK
jgi:hypothetical protein